MARILIAGAGALGSVFGGFLQRYGHAVTLLGRAPHLAAIATGGLRIDGIWGECSVDGFALVSDAAQLVGRFDCILVTVKSFDTAGVAARLADHLVPDGIVVSLQNGLGNIEALQGELGPERVLGGRVIFGATIPHPGAVRVTVYAEPVLLGAWGEAPVGLADTARAWAVEITRIGIPTQYTANLPAALWGKVFYNAALNPLGALLGVHYGALAEDEATRSIMDEVIGEAHAVACAEGISLPWPSAAAYRELFYDRLLPPTYDHRSSMLQDLERGRRTEIDAINGEVWRRGQSHAIATPNNALLTRLVRARHHGMAGR